MKQETFESFVTFVLELKLDQGTMFEWQRHSQDSKDVPPYSDLLEILDLRVQACTNTIHDSDKRRSRPIEKKTLSTETVVHC